MDEILFEPRWDIKEFDRLKNETIEGIKRNKTSASSTASLVFSKLIYGNENIISKNTAGTEESVSALTLDDLKNYYAKGFSPQNANITIAGDINEDDAMEVFKVLESNGKKLILQFHCQQNLIHSVLQKFTLWIFRELNNLKLELDRLD